MRIRRQRRPWQPEPGVLVVVRVLLLLQAGFALLSAFGAAFLGVATGAIVPVLPAAGVTVATALAILLVLPRLARGSNRARRLVVLGEAVALLFSATDVVLTFALLHGLPGIVTLTTRVVLPVFLLRLLRREPVGQGRLSRAWRSVRGRFSTRAGEPA